MNRFAGTSTLVALIARRDRVRLAIWAYVIAGLIASTAYSFRTLYHSVPEREAFGRSIAANPTLLAIDGPLFDSTSTGGLTAWRFGGLAAVAAAMVSILTVIRHTRAEEESGRVELVAAGVVGRFAPLTAALIVAVGVDVIAGAVIVAVMVALGAAVAGSVALGAGVAAAGIAFAGVAAVAAQVTDGSRAANGGAFAVLGLAFALRAAGDSTSANPSGGSLSFLSWLSPIGWAQQVRPYAAGERWWVLTLGLGLGAAAVTVAYAMVSRRDVGAGLLGVRLGPAAAARSLRTPLALAWRQHRASLVGWSIGLVLLGVVFGSSAKGVDKLIDTSAQLADVIDRLGGTRQLTDAYFSATLGLCGLVAAAYGIQAVMRARSEETAGRAEAILATPVRRSAFAGSHLLLAAAGTAVLLTATGLGAGLAYGIAVHDIGRELPTLLGAALAQWPAAVVPGAIAALLFGGVPRWTGAAWGALGLFVLLGQLGPLLRLSQIVMDVSPFTHTPKIPASGGSAMPSLVLTAIALVLTTAGLMAFGRRNID
jgi:ABC-2 type transport system permease protein